MQYKKLASLLITAVALTLSTRVLAADSDPTAAIVNGQELKRSEILSRIESIGQHLPRDKAYAEILDKLIEMTILVQAAKRENIDKNIEYQKLLARMTERLLLETFISQHIPQAVTKDIVAEAVKKLPPKQEAKLSVILLKDQKEAQHVVNALKAKGDFKKIAQERSIDPSGKRGGEIGFVLEDKLPSDVLKAITPLKVNDFTKSPLETPMGFYVIKLHERRPASFESLEPFVRDQLEKTALQKLVETETAKAKVKRFSEDGKLLEESVNNPLKK